MSTLTKVLAINEIYTADEPLQYICHGLGSCIGLFIMDRLQKLSGGAHIPMPVGGNGQELKSAAYMIQELLQSLVLMGSDLSCLRAKMTGGAQVYHGSSVGEENIHAVRQCLFEKKIFIAAIDVGGTAARTAKFNSLTGDLHISTSDRKTYFI